MNSMYEIVEFPDKLPVRCFLYSVESFRLHWHREVEFLVVLKGAINVMVQDAVVTLSAGDVGVISSGLIHATQSTGEPNVLLVVQIACEQLGAPDESAEGRTFALRGDENANARLRYLLCGAMLEMAYKQQGYQHKTMALVSGALAVLWREFPHSPSQTPEGGRQKERERIDRIVSYINERYAARLTLTEIAASEHLSVNHLSTFIHKSLGMSFGDYVKYVRLRAYMECLQTDSVSSLDDIAVRCGFSSPQYAASLFRNTYRVTPGKYRKRLSQMTLVRQKALDADTVMGYIPQYQPDDLSLVQKYASMDEPGKRRFDAPAQMEDISIDASRTVGEYHASAVGIAAIGRAHDGLQANVQRQIIEMKKALGFSYLRFHGILSDDMMIARPEPSGSVAYSWRSVDALLDFLLQNGIKPFLELTYMPSLLASGEKTVFLWRGNISPPADEQAWRRLLGALVAHCVWRYGEREVLTWYFEVWNEPDYTDVSFAGTLQEFLHFYLVTAEAVVQALPGARVLGPSVSMATEQSARWLGAFLDFCQQKGAPLSGVTLHAYPEKIRPDELMASLRRPLPANMTERDILPQDYVTRILTVARRQLAQRGMRDLPLIVTEWNISLKAYNPINDSAYAGTALLRSALDADASDTQLVHWALTDYMEESPLPAGEMIGGFGLCTCRGVRKPMFFAMRALSRLHGSMVYRDERVILTKSGDDYRMIAYCHPALPIAFDNAYAQHAAPSDPQRRDARALRVTLTGLTPGRYAVVRRPYSEATCSPKALARASGLKEPMTDGDARWLAEASQPGRVRETARVQADGALNITVALSACGFESVDFARLPE